jgi:hypothetical protein
MLKKYTKLTRLQYLYNECKYTNIHSTTEGQSHERILAHSYFEKKIEQKLEFEKEKKEQPSLSLLNIEPNEKEESSYLGVRLILYRLGQLSFDHLKESSTLMLNKTPALLRDIRGIDKQYS